MAKTKSQAKKIIIIGSGFGGLSATALLAKEGFDITVFEKNEGPGGRASVLKEKGFTFDMGPSWYMMPEVFERFFKEFGKSSKDFYTLKKLIPQYRVIFDDKKNYDITGIASDDKKIFESLEKGSYKEFQRYLKDAQTKYELSMNHVLYKNINTIFGFLNKDIAGSTSFKDLFIPLHKHVTHYFRSERIQQLIEYMVVFLGASPSIAPAIFSMITYAGFKLGVWYPMGGMGKVVDAMYTLGKENGATFHFKSPVEKIIVENGKAKGVVVKGKTHEADIIISNADYAFTESLFSNSNLKNYTKKYWAKKKFAPSAFLIYLGVKGKIPRLLHHTLYLGDNWKKHFEAIFDTPDWYPNPSLYINKPSETDNSVAPKGYENIMVLVPIAPGLREDKKSKEKYAQYILNYLEEKLDIQFQKNIVYKKIFSVSDFENRYNSYKGNALGGLAHTLLQSSIWRSNNKHPKVKGLYFSGANTNPGIGVPPAIISGHLVRDRILKDYPMKKI